MRSKVIACTVCGLALVGAALALADGARDMAILLKAAGKVEVGSALDRRWKPGTRGTRLSSGDRIRTGENSLATLIFTDDKSLLKLRGDSELTLGGEREKGIVSKRLKVDAGELWAKITKGGGGYRLETPSGVAAVKGTEFYLLVAEDGSTTAIVLEGVIELINSLGSILVEKGYTGIMHSDAPPDTSESGNVPDWGGEDLTVTGEEGQLRIEFRDESGQKRFLLIRYNPR
ncbi:MAG: FecR family protein [candidate division KSB1 bacterium]|nr:FecR family protein [candidate division KSB1 bacterium]